MRPEAPSALEGPSFRGDKPEAPSSPVSPIKGDFADDPSEVDVDTSVPYSGFTPQAPEPLGNSFRAPTAPGAPVAPPTPKSPYGRAPRRAAAAAPVEKFDVDMVEDGEAPSCSLEGAKEETVKAFKADAFKEVSTEECTKEACDVEGL